MISELVHRIGKGCPNEEGTRNHVHKLHNWGQISVIFWHLQAL